jgi:hypothetical protein
VSDFSVPAQAYPKVTILSLGPEAVGAVCAGGACVQTANPVSQTWGTANLACYIPFVLSAPFLAQLMLYYVGATNTGNIDAGIYDEEGNKVVTKGSTAVGTAGTLQSLDITDTLLNPGRYYMAANCDTATSTVFAYTCTAQQAQIMGMLNEAVGAVTLPSPATFAAATATRVPLIGVSGRALL